MSKSKDEKYKNKNRVEKESKKNKKGKSSSKADKITEDQAPVFSLLADEKTTNPALSSLFAARPTPPQPKPIVGRSLNESHEVDADDDVVNDEGPDDDDAANGDLPVGAEDELHSPEEEEPRRRRKRNHDEDEVEDVYMRRLAREEAEEVQAAVAERAAKRQKATVEDAELDLQKDDTEDENLAELNEDHVTPETNGISTLSREDDLIIPDEDALSLPPLHETQTISEDLTKAQRTVFLANVSTAAITSRTARKTLMTHLTSFCPRKTPDSDSKDAVESLRFRSTPYDPSIPKKAAYATQKINTSTAHSTNAYAVYTTSALAREAVIKLNGTVVLDRHLRADSVAHPAKIDHHRCVFVGNLGFVDDESAIRAANAEEGYENRKMAKQPADIEEGLWRTFGKCGTVENVRVVRDAATRVGKGIAYVQFESEVGVEAALGLDGKKFPPMLPRKLRVSRAKAIKRNAGKKEADKFGKGAGGAQRGTGYRRKIGTEESSRVGRAAKLYGRAGAAKVAKSTASTGANSIELGDGIKKPEAFVFEGHRARSGSGKAGLKLGGRKKKAKGVTSRSRAFRANGK